ncbi:MAG TPA: hypothetical protein VFS15_26530 [Kofleriaceae bacterium]|nr:hypothetical protein [Kofleriaceae bacterium]
MTRALLLGVVVVLCSARAEADPLVRFGMTFGLNGNIPEAQEFGPLVAVGASSGRFSAEANYAYLSFFDDDTRIHRVGVALRMDLARSYSLSGQSRAFYGEVGAAERRGYWRVGEYVDPQHKSIGELQLGVGYELADSTASWQLALRLGLARRDPELDTVCRGTSCMVPEGMSQSSVAESVMVEWTWILGR